MKKVRNRIFDFFFVKRILPALLVGFAVICGFFSFRAMPRESLPDLEIPQALVMAFWPGASPTMVETEITDVIEKELKSVSTIKTYRSGSMDSASVTSVEFDVDAPVKESMRILRTKVEEASARLPKDVKKPLVEEFGVTDIPILTFAVHGDASNEKLSTLAKKLKTRIERIRGIKKAVVSGVGERTVEVQLDVPKMASLGISPSLVKFRLDETNYNVSYGRIESEGLNASMNMVGRFNELNDLRELPISGTAVDRVIPLKEFATVQEVVTRPKTKTSISTEQKPFAPCLSISVYKRPGSDTVSLVSRVKDEMKKARAMAIWPSDVDLHVTSDESLIIEDNLNTVFGSVWQGALIVFAVLLVLLTWREAIIVGLSIPLTFLGTLVVIDMMGYTLNELVIIGMVLSLGILVDDFILVMEGMHEGMSMKQLSFKEAARYTVKSYLLPSLSGSLTTIIVFVPLLYIGGIDGKFIRLIPITMSVSLLLSFAISFLIDIPLSGVLLINGKRADKLSWVDRLTAKASRQLSAWLMANSVRSRKAAFSWGAGALAVFALSAVLVSQVPTTLYPKSDARNLGITVELSPETSRKKTEETAKSLGKVLASRPYFESVIRYSGRRSPYAEESISDWLNVSEAPWLIGFSCGFVDKEARDKRSFEYLKALRSKLETALGDTPGASVRFSLNTGGTSSADPLQINIFGPDTDTLRRLASNVARELKRLPNLEDISNPSEKSQAEVRLIPDLKALNFYGISPSEFTSQTRMLMSQVEAGRLRFSGHENERPIYIGARWPSRNGTIGTPQSHDEIAQLTIYGDNNQPVPLLSVIKSMSSYAPMSVTRFNGQRVATISGQTQGPLSASLGRIERMMNAQHKNWPSGYSWRIGGEAQATENVTSSASRAFVVAAALVFAILALLFGSFVQPLLILFSVPLALIGTFGGFFLLWTPLSFPAMVGLISLVGIVVNDAIVMVERMNVHRRNGMPVREAAAMGASERLRPIVSTSVTTTVGLIPLAFSNAMWMPLCMAIIFGLIASTILSLCVIPSLFFVATSK